MTFNPFAFGKINTHFNIVLKTFQKYGQLMESPKSKNLRMIDIGTGPGRLILEIEKMISKDYNEILCVDKSIEMIEYFDSLVKDSRIRTGTFDIESKEIPKDLSGRFDMVFSSYCFTYTRNLSQVFKNCNRFLRPGGELFAIWAKIPHIYDIYRQLSSTKKWGQYTEDYKDWTNQFIGENSSELLPPLLKEFGFEILACDDLNNNEFSYKTVEEIQDIMASLDTVSNRIPKCDLQKYRNDYNKLALKYIRTDEDDKDGLRVKHFFPSIAVVAKKIKSV